MTPISRSTAAVGGLALFAAVSITIGMTAGESDVGTSGDGARLRLLPAEPRPANVPAIAATPAPLDVSHFIGADAGIWSTPAEFAPPE